MRASSKPRSLRPGSRVRAMAREVSKAKADNEGKVSEAESEVEGQGEVGEAESEAEGEVSEADGGMGIRVGMGIRCGNCSFSFMGGVVEWGLGWAGAQKTPFLCWREAEKTANLPRCPSYVGRWRCSNL
jgi:hypothetical protein